MESPLRQKCRRNAEIFAHYNRWRIECLHKGLSERSLEVLELIPLLLHESGYELDGEGAGENAPCGITCFSYTSYRAQLAKKYFPGFSLQRRVKPRPAIQFLALIGSAGTVAFTWESDMDFWVGIDTRCVEGYALELLQEKFRSIEHWARRVAEMELHFFAADPEKIRNGDFGMLGGESCGSALGSLLKDEFYRTGVFLEGKMPFYWIMPAGLTESQYQRNVGALHLLHDFPAANYVDLGNITVIDRAEFFGAALWQLLKAFRSPFKSVLKMALLDMYSAEAGEVPPLCERFKEKLLRTEVRSTADPYLYMVNAVRRFYDGRGWDSVQELLEECFLIRNLFSSSRHTAANKARLAHFVHIGSTWGHDQARVLDCAGFRLWDYQRRQDLYERVLGFLVQSYQRIRRRMPEAKTRISERDLTVLGRKLQCMLMRKPDKIPFEVSAFSAGDFSRIAFTQEQVLKGTANWMVRLTVRGAGEGLPQVARTFPNPIIACVWVSINGFFDNTQRIEIPGSTLLTVKSAVALMKEAAELFPPGDPYHVETEELLEPEHATHVMIVPNWDGRFPGRGVSSAALLLRTTMGEFVYSCRRGDDCINWLTRELLARVRAPYLRKLAWKVHRLRNTVAGSRSGVEEVEKAVKGLVARMG